MSFTDLNDRVGNGTAVAGSTTLVLATGATYSDVIAGDLVVIGWSAENNTRTIASVTDDGTGGQSWDISPTPKSGLTLSGGFVWCRATGPDFGTNLTITLGGGTSDRISALMMAWHALNGNPKIDKNVSAGPDNASPVDAPTTGTLLRSDELGLQIQCWRGGAVASGWAHTVPATGWVTGTIGGLSGGATSRVETRMSFATNLGATTAYAATSTYTSLSAAHVFSVTFTDDAIRHNQTSVRRVWAGR